MYYVYIERVRGRGDEIVPSEQDTLCTRIVDRHTPLRSMWLSCIVCAYSDTPGGVDGGMDFSMIRTGNQWTRVVEL